MTYKRRYSDLHIVLWPQYYFWANWRWNRRNFLSLGTVKVHRQGTSKTAALKRRTSGSAHSHRRELVKGDCLRGLGPDEEMAVRGKIRAQLRRKQKLRQYGNKQNSNNRKAIEERNCFGCSRSINITLIWKTSFSRKTTRNERSSGMAVRTSRQKGSEVWKSRRRDSTFLDLSRRNSCHLSLLSSCNRPFSYLLRIRRRLISEYHE